MKRLCFYVYRLGTALAANQASLALTINQLVVFANQDLGPAQTPITPLILQPLPTP